MQQVYLVVQLGLKQSTCSSHNIICHNATCPRSAHGVGHMPLYGIVIIGLGGRRKVENIFSCTL